MIRLWPFPDIRLLLTGCALAVALAAPLQAQNAATVAIANNGSAQGKPALGLMGTIPIYWGEASGLGEVIGGTADLHWARAQLDGHFTLQPIDRLTATSLSGLNFLLLAQPRALAADENLALDAWVREGGRLLLFADPLLTGESRFSIGDRRRPQDVILLSPILRHWGLELRFDDNQPGSAKNISVPGGQLPVRLPGSFESRDSEGGGDCRIFGESVLAHCQGIGVGEAVIVADAALLDLHDTPKGASAALAWLMRESFGISGEIPGNLEKSNIIDLNQLIVSDDEAPDRAGWPPGHGK